MLIGACNPMLCPIPRLQQDRYGWLLWVVAMGGCYGWMLIGACNPTLCPIHVFTRYATAGRERGLLPAEDGYVAPRFRLLRGLHSISTLMLFAAIPPALFGM